MLVNLVGFAVDFNVAHIYGLRRLLMTLVISIRIVVGALRIGIELQLLILVLVLVDDSLMRAFALFTILTAVF